MSYEQDFFSARLIKQIAPEIPLKVDGEQNGYRMITEDNIKEAIEYDIKSILLTEKGERFDKNFGVGIKSYLFESVGTTKIAQLPREISKQISRYMPWLSQFNVKSDTNIKENLVSVGIKYKINEISIVGFFNMSVSLDDL